MNNFSPKSLQKLSTRNVFFKKKTMQNPETKHHSKVLKSQSLRLLPFWLVFFSLINFKV